MTRDRAIAAAEAYFDEGGFAEDLARRVAIPSESQVPNRASMLAHYLDGLKANVLIASDGPRLGPQRPTLFLGARGAFNFDMHVELRPGSAPGAGDHERHLLGPRRTRGAGLTRPSVRTVLPRPRRT